MYVNKYFTTRNYFTKQESIPVGCIPPAFLILGGLPTETPWTETPQTETLWTENPGRNMGPGNQTGSDIIQRPPCGQTDTCETLPCPQLCLRAENIAMSEARILTLFLLHNSPA